MTYTNPVHTATTIEVATDPTTDPKTLDGFTTVLDNLVETLWPGTSIETITSLTTGVVGAVGFIVGLVNPSGTFSSSARTEVTIAGLAVVILIGIVHLIFTSRTKATVVKSAVDAASLHLNYKASLHHTDAMMAPAVPVVAPVVAPPTVAVQVAEPPADSTTVSSPTS